MKNPLTEGKTLGSMCPKVTNNTRRPIKPPPAPKKKTVVDESLAVKYIEYMDKDEEDRGETFDDFFDWVGLPIESRKDFVVGLIIEQAREILKNEST
jgi:hypothetical protein